MIQFTLYAYVQRIYPYFFHSNWQNGKYYALGMMSESKSESERGRIGATSWERSESWISHFWFVEPTENELAKSLCSR